MTFSEFAKVIIKFVGCSPEEITQNLVDGISNIGIEDIMKISPSGWSKYYHGKANFKKIANIIKDKYDKEYFYAYLDDYFNDDNISKLINEFNNIGCNVKKDSWKEDITNIFISIIDEANGITTIDNTNEEKNLDLELKNLDHEIISTVNKDFQEADKEIKEAFNNTFQAINALQTNKLNPELKEYFDVEYNHVNNQSFGLLVPKNDEALKKYPYNILIMPQEDTSKERERLKKYLDTIQREANLTNKSVEVKESFKLVEKLGNYDNPYPLFNRLDKLTLNPDPNLRSSLFTLRVFNKHYDLTFRDIEMWLLDYDKDHFIFSNIREEKADFILRIELIHENGKPNTKTTFSTKEEYIGDASANKRNYLWRILTADKKSTFELTSKLVGKVAIKAEGFGKESFSTKDYNEFKRVINYFDKIKFIEDVTGKKIDVTGMHMDNEIPSIDFIYYSLKRKSKTFRRKMYFDMELDKEYITDFKEGATLVNVESDLAFAELRGITFDLYNTEVKMEKVEVIKLEKLNNKKYKVYYQTDKVEMIVN
ncbi:MAG: hypothetical protein IKP07_02405 [Bacilli bacterium]|nr:hypothetical protein [Bacilli bacterium]